MAWYEIKAAAGDTAEVWVYDIIGEDWFSEGVTAKAMAEQLSAITAPNIDLHVNSPGGSVFDGQAIYNALRRHPAKVTSYVDGVAASIASVIALAGAEQFGGGGVVIADNALMMIHNAWGMKVGSAAEMRKYADVLEQVDGTLRSTYATVTGRDESEVADAMEAETWYTAAEAIEWGLADRIDESLAAAACAFDFNALGYRNAPTVSPSAEASASGDGAPTLSEKTTDEEDASVSVTVSDASDAPDELPQVYYRDIGFRKTKGVTRT